VMQLSAERLSEADMDLFGQGLLTEDKPKMSVSKRKGRVPPHSIDAEQSVLGAVLLDNEAMHSAVELLQAEDFYLDAHRVLFSTMLRLLEEHIPIDAVTLVEGLREGRALETVGGIEYISRLVDAVPTAANVEFYAHIVKENSLRRRVIREASEIVEEAFDDTSSADTFIDNVEQRMLKVSDQRTRRSFHRISDLVKESIKSVERLYINKQPITGVPSGFVDFDHLTSGLQPSDLIIIAGRPAMGKTSLALSIARHVGVDVGSPVAVFSLEMSREQIVMRLLCSEARVDNSRARSGRLEESDFPKLVEAASRLAQAPIFIDDTPAISVLEMRAKARRLNRESPLGLIVVDYLQLMRGNTRQPERREQEISEISRSLKALAKELNLPILALSQLNRSVETRQDKRPLMADLRESGAIEQDADIISFVYRDEVYNPETSDKGVAEFIVSKHRNGPIGTVRLAFQAEYTLFENLADEGDYDYLGESMGFGPEEEDRL